jgi:hypothetical protein
MIERTRMLPSARPAEPRQEHSAARAAAQRSSARPPRPAGAGAVSATRARLRASRGLGHLPCSLLEVLPNFGVILAAAIGPASQLRATVSKRAAQLSGRPAGRSRGKGERLNASNFVGCSKLGGRRLPVAARAAQEAHDPRRLDDSGGGKQILDHAQARRVPQPRQGLQNRVYAVSGTAPMVQQW